MSEIRTVAVLTDMHFTASKEKEDIDQTHVVLNEPTTKKQYPPSDLLDLIRDNGLKADTVLCAGDITVSADHTGLVSAWGFVNDVANALSASDVIATTGNHDISSRDFKTSPEIWEALKRLTPPYPFPRASELQQLMYWGSHFLIADLGWARVVSLNTCNSHSRGQTEYNHGRITDLIIEQLSEKLGGDTPGKINILLCHHHPAKHPAITQSYEDYSEMAHGAKLLEQLQKHSSDWLVIHGHRHSPRLHYAQGSGSGPAILSAGSLSAKLETSFFPVTTNQFYLVDFDAKQCESLGQVGTIRAWDWIKTNGWIPATYDENRSHRIINGSGFGMRITPRYYATKIYAAFSGESVIRWEDVMKQFPELRFVVPDDMQALLRDLHDRYGYDAIGKDPIDPLELVK